MNSRVISFRHIAILLFFALSIMLTGCGQGSTTGNSSNTASSTPTAASTPAVDFNGNPIVFPSTAPQRIVSLVPSTSEILGALGLQDKVVGVDYYTDYPASMAKVNKVSDANGKFSIEQIVALKPDLILTYGNETKQYNDELKKAGLNLVDLPLSNLSQTLQEILVVGRLTFTQDKAQTLVKQLQQQIDQIKAAVAGTSTPKVLLEVDDSTPGKPYVFGGGTFGDELLQDASAVNIFHNNTSNGGYPQVADEAVISANPDYIILTEIPDYGGKVDLVYKRPNWGNIEAVKMKHVYRINSNIMQRPGPRLVEGLRCLAQTIHPDKFTGALPDYCSATV